MTFTYDYHGVYESDFIVLKTTGTYM